MTTSRTILDLFPSCAGLFGAAGIAISAAAAHRGGGSAAATAGMFLILHASVLIGLSAAASPLRTRRFAVAGAVLALGTILFSGDLALAGLMDWRPLPQAAPAGGVLLMAGWLILPVWQAIEVLRGRFIRRSRGGARRLDPRSPIS